MAREHASICKARRRDGQPCRAIAAYGTTVCTHHGGKGLAAIRETGANVKHGAYAKSLPPDLQGVYEAALGDPEMRTADHEVALLRAHLTRYLERTQGTLADSGKSMEHLSLLIDRLTSAIKRAQEVRTLAEGALTKAQAFTVAARLHGVLSDVIERWMPQADRAAARDYIRRNMADMGVPNDG